MTPLRQEMIRAMELRNLSKHTKRNHLGSVDRLSRYYNKSPDQLTKEQIEDYLLYLKNERGNTLGTCGVVASGIRFFFKHVVKKKLELDFHVTTKRDKLPTVLTQRQAWALINAPSNIKHRLLLMTAYSAGLRAMEVARLKPEHIHSDKMLIEVVDGKGRSIARWICTNRRKIKRRTAPMTQIIKLPTKPLQVADIIRMHMADYRQSYTLFPEQQKIVSHLTSCRTEKLGGRIERCDNCALLRILYHSCRDRHCPTCQQIPRERWCQDRKREILPVPYYGEIKPFKDKLYRHKWVVSVRDPINNPEHVLEYGLPMVGTGMSDNGFM